MATPRIFNLDSENLGSEIVTIYVGPKRKSFTVHKKLLCERSSYFLKAFASGFKEGAEGVMYMKEEHVDAFENLVNWIYRDQLPSFPSRDFPDSIDGWENFGQTVTEPLFFMAEKLCIDEICNKIMDVYQDSHLRLGLMLGSEEIMRVYANTHENTYNKIAYSRLCREILGNMADLLKSTPDFATDFTILQLTYGYRFRERKEADLFIRTGPQSFGQCFFHTHSKDEVCNLEPEKKKKGKV
ncbi:hypothetical protein LHYA1_G006988 [Lachnellula hyalina]|uniref:BTB domain-containing protein n=1 Tax=Lachnellula hyalina TaxID=1316788 RepID=A0A8H8TYN2_9HELO|nr:uncharacterized protein LHYA1_G006988 [Lachnellula hyalina]TVY24071.1 hypothetical protein LHYA1_G006988 [Lachnellula hyalina]